MNKTLEKIGELGIVPSVKIEKAEDVLPLGRALINGDLPIAEITLLIDFSLNYCFRSLEIK
jgi:2-dehydro-3-deoxyphosphogluconate aldolase/(4S)-4-hydroxy-2-oxoglutarate aldolase